MANRMESRLSRIVIQFFGGAARRVAPADTAFAQRQAEYNVGIETQWTDAAESEKHIGPDPADRAREAWLLIGREGFADWNYTETGLEGQQFLLSSRFTSASAVSPAHRSEGARPSLPGE